MGHVLKRGEAEAAKVVYNMYVEEKKGKRNNRGDLK